jgi:hypothetical protein
MHVSLQAAVALRLPVTRLVVDVALHLSLLCCSCRLLWYKEPTPEPVGDLEAHLIGKVEVRAAHLCGGKCAEKICRVRHMLRLMMAAL